MPVARDEKSLIPWKRVEVPELMVNERLSGKGVTTVKDPPEAASAEILPRMEDSFPFAGPVGCGAIGRAVRLKVGEMVKGSMPLGLHWVNAADCEVRRSRVRPMGPSSTVMGEGRLTVTCDDGVKP